MLRRGGPRLFQLLVEESKVPTWYSICVPWVPDLPTYRNFQRAKKKRKKQDGIMYNHWYNVLSGMDGWMDEWMGQDDKDRTRMCTK